MEEVIKCRFQRSIFEGDGGFTVCTYQNTDNKRRFRAVGFGLPTMADLTVALSGAWETNTKYKEPAFKVTSFEVVPPQREREFVAYVKSLHCGIGVNTAKAIWNKFEMQTWSLLENEPERLLEVRGVSQKRLDNLLDKLQETRVMRDLMQLFDGNFDVSPRKINAVIAKLGVGAAEIVRQKPYTLCDIDGFAFEHVDAFARTTIGVKADDDDRIKYGVHAVFRDAAARGHMCLPLDVINAMVLSKLNRPFAGQHPVGDAQYKKAMREMSHDEDNGIRVSGGMVYEHFRLEEERATAKHIERLLHAPDKNEWTGVEQIDAFMRQYQQESGVTYADGQLHAVQTALTSFVSVITGGPGTGKTTVIKAVLAAHKALSRNSSPVLLAPTGRAARRMTQQTGVEASTIHSALGLTGTDADEAITCTLDANIVIVDESSMLDGYVAHRLFNAIATGCRIVLVGDVNQLPSVGAGNVLAEIIRSQQVPVARLDVIYRQAETNPIVPNAAKIVEGQTNLLEDAKYFRFVEASEPIDILKHACSLYVRAVRTYGIDNVILLNPYRDKGNMSCAMLNRQLQHLLNPEKEGESVLKSHGEVFRVGDKVMQLKNTPGPKNGDVGYVEEVLYVPKSEGSTDLEIGCRIDFNGEKYIYRKSDMDHVTLAYSCTVHKSQGSEYPVVIIVACREHSNLLKRNLVYTAVTRASEIVAVVGERTAFDKGIQDNQLAKRFSLLGDFIHAFGQAASAKEGIA